MILLLVTVASIAYSADLNSREQHEHPMPNQKNKVMSLKPVVFKPNNQGPNHYALDPVDTADTYPELVLKNNAGVPIGVNYAAFIPILIQQVQKLQQANK